MARSLGVVVARARKGKIVSARGRSPSARKKLRRFIRAAEKAKRLDEWRRGRAVLGYIEGRSVVELAGELDVDRSTVTRWLQWYEAIGIEGLQTGKSPGPTPKLKPKQCDVLVELIEEGPPEAGYTSGVWTGPMIGDLIAQRFGVRYHNLNEEGKAWLGVNKHRIELHRLPAYSPEFNPIEGVWKETKKQTTHNRFFHTTDERDAALTATFKRFNSQPTMLAGQVARFL